DRPGDETSSGPAVLLLAGCPASDASGLSAVAGLSTVSGPSAVSVGISGADEESCGRGGSSGAGRPGCAGGVVVACDGQPPANASCARARRQRAARNDDAPGGVLASSSPARGCSCVVAVSVP